MNFRKVSHPAKDGLKGLDISVGFKPTITMNMTTVLKNLESDFEVFINKTDQFEFFTGLADYADHALQVPAIQKLVEKVMERKLNQYDKLAELEDKTLNELRKAKNKLLKTVSDANLKPSSLRPITTFPIGNDENESVITILNQFEDGQVTTNGFHSDSLENYLWDIAVGIANQNPDLVREFIIPGQRSNNTNTEFAFLFSKTIKLRREQANVIEQEQRLDIWGVFDKLLKFQKAFREVSLNTNFQDILIKYGSDGRNYLETRDAVDITFYAQDFRRFMSMKYERTLGTGVIYHLIIPDFKLYVTRANSFILNELAGSKTIIEQQPVEPKKIEHIILTPEERDMLKQEIKQEVLVEIRADIATSNLERSVKPHCIEEEGFGYLKFGKYTEKIPISKSTSQQYKLLSLMIDPLDTARTTEVAYETIRLEKHKKDSRLNNIQNAPFRKYELVDNVIADLQKDTKLRNRLYFVWDELKRTLRLKFRG